MAVGQSRGWGVGVETSSSESKLLSKQKTKAKKIIIIIQCSSPTAASNYRTIVKYFL